MKRIFKKVLLTIILVIATPFYWIGRFLNWLENELGLKDNLDE